MSCIIKRHRLRLSSDSSLITIIVTDYMTEKLAYSIHNSQFGWWRKSHVSRYPWLSSRLLSNFYGTPQ